MTEQLAIPAPATKVTGPGVWPLTAAEYHADPVPGGSLSSTAARKLLPPSCPAKYRHWADNPAEVNDDFDLGSAAHQLVLGAGPELVVVEGDGKGGPEAWTTNAVKEKVAAVRAAGAIPLRPSAFETVTAMAAALREHPFAGQLFAPGTGEPEQALVWVERGSWMEEVDGEFVGRSAEVRCRALVDWLPHPQPGRRLILADFKTCVSAAPDDAVKAIARYGYHTQLSFYLRGLRALGRADESAIGVLVMQEKTAPYLVTVIQPDRTAMRLGEKRCREAIDLYAQCTATGRWPGYSDDVVIGELPPWETRELDGAVW